MKVIAITRALIIGFKQRQSKVDKISSGTLCSDDSMQVQQKEEIYFKPQGHTFRLHLQV